MHALSGRLRWLTFWATLALLAVVAVATSFGAYGNTNTSHDNALASSGCNPEPSACAESRPTAWAMDVSARLPDPAAPKGGQLAGQFQALGHTVFVAGCYTLDLHQVTYLGPDGSSTYVVRWCG